MSSADRAVFALWRAAAALRHPRLHWKYIRRMRRLPDLARPWHYSEQMLWRKLFDRDPRFVAISDKLACKAVWATLAPGLAVPAVLWEGTDPEALPPELIRPGVAIKANHGSGFNLLIRDAVPPREEVVATARRWLGTAWGRRRGEWAYAPIPRRIFVEELVAPEPGLPLYDIKIHAGGGRIGLCGVLSHTKTPAQRSSRFDEHGVRLAERMPGYAAQPDDMAVPPAFHAAVAWTRRASQAFDYARFDFLASGERLHGGEITLFSAAGYRDYGEPAASLMREVWDLRRSWFLREGASGAGWLARAYAGAFLRAAPRDA